MVRVPPCSPVSFSWSLFPWIIGEPVGTGSATCVVGSGALDGAVIYDGVGGSYVAGARSLDCGPAQLNRGINSANANKRGDDFKNCKLKLSSRLVNLIDHKSLNLTGRRIVRWKGISPAHHPFYVGNLSSMLIKLADNLPEYICDSNVWPPFSWYQVESIRV